MSMRENLNYVSQNLWCKLKKHSFHFFNTFLKQRFHGTSIVQFDSERGGISLEQEKTETGTTSRLLITKANFRDSGNYSCVPIGALSASVIVHVLNGNWRRLCNVESTILTCY